MMDANEVIRSSTGTTVQHIVDQYEGRLFETADDEPRFYCDWCSTGVAYSREPTVAQYVVDLVLDRPSEHPLAKYMHRERPYVQMASYCQDCATHRLLFPCEGFGELRTFFDIELDEPGGKPFMRNYRVTDASDRDDGIPWNPRELSERITGVPFSENRKAGHEMELWGPENMVSTLLSVGGIDIRELVDWKGEVNPRVLGRARKEYRKFGEKMHQGGFERRAFRDHVRGDR